MKFRHWMASAAALLNMSLGCNSTYADDLRPALLEIVEQAPNRFVINAKLPPGLSIGSLPEVRLLAPSCERVDSGNPGNTEDYRPQSLPAIYSCVNGLAQAELLFVYRDFNPSANILVGITWLSGEHRMLALKTGERRMGLPSPETFGSVAVAYMTLGVTHILTSLDHLLFVVCLLCIAGTARRVALTITGFTLAHSVTLGLSTLGIIRLPVAPMEACIALSVVMLAAELVRRRRDTLAWRFPILVSLVFGLLHGFGFASTLNGIGVPENRILGALLFFNIGIEIGQLVFATVVLFCLALVRSLCRGKQLRLFPTGATGSSPTTPLVGYTVGGISVFWLIQRLASLGV